MADKECRCNALARVVAGGVEFRNLRCPACVDAILEAKNELVRENNRLREWGALMTAPPSVPLEHPVDMTVTF